MVTLYKSQRINAVATRNRVKKLIKEGPYYKPFSAKGASDKLGDVTPKTARKYLEELVGERTNGGRIRRTYSNGQVLYQKDPRPMLCEMKKKAEEKCRDGEKESCIEADVHKSIARALDISCEDELGISSSNKHIDIRKFTPTMRNKSLNVSS